MSLAAKRGLTYPLEVDINGQLKTSTDYNLVREHILSVLDTRPYERALRADYGLPDLIFEVINPILINSRISKAILDEVTELSDLEVDGEWRNTGEEGIYQVKITYFVNGIPQPPISFALQR